MLAKRLPTGPVARLLAVWVAFLVTVAVIDQMLGLHGPAQSVAAVLVGAGFQKMGVSLLPTRKAKTRR